MANDPYSDTIRQLFSKGQPLAFGKGDVILGNEPALNGVYYINSGYVKIYSISDNGDQYIHIIYGPRDIFPLVWAYLDIQPDSLYYEAISDCVVWRLSREWFTEFATHNIKLSYALSRQLAYQFQVFSDRVDNLEYKKASERVAYRLLFLASRFGTREDGTITIDAPITHEIVANTINLARESVSREIEKLEEQHIIEQFDHRIRILDVPALVGQLSRPINLHNWNLL